MKDETIAGCITAYLTAAFIYYHFPIRWFAYTFIGVSFVLAVCGLYAVCLDVVKSVRSENR